MQLNEPRHEKTCLCYMRTTKAQISLRIKTLASFWSWASRFESYLVGNPEDRLSRDEAQLTTKHAFVSISFWMCITDEGKGCHVSQEKDLQKCSLKAHSFVQCWRRRFSKSVVFFFIKNSTKISNFTNVGGFIVFLISYIVQITWKLKCDENIRIIKKILWPNSLFYFLF